MIWQKKERKSTYSFTFFFFFQTQTFPIALVSAWGGSGKEAADLCLSLQIYLFLKA